MRPYIESWSPSPEQGKVNAQEGVAQGDQEIARATTDAQERRQLRARGYHLKVAAYSTEWRDYWVKLTEYYERLHSGYRRAVNYHSGLAHKYARAAGRPWRSVGLDPPEPHDPMLDGNGYEQPRASPDEVRFLIGSAERTPGSDQSPSTNGGGGLPKASDRRVRR